MSIVPARFERDEPAVYGQNFGRDDRFPSIPDGVGAVDTNVARADGGFAPASVRVEAALSWLVFVPVGLARRTPLGTRTLMRRRYRCSASSLSLSLASSGVSGARSLSIINFRSSPRSM